MQSSQPLWHDLVLEMAAFCALTASIVLLWRDNLLLFGIVLAEGLLVLRRWHDRHDVCFCLVLAVLGSVAEAVYVHFGVWRYANPTFLGIPLWFPVSFATAGVTGERLARTIAAMWQSRESRSKGGSSGARSQLQGR